MTPEQLMQAQKDIPSDWNLGVEKRFTTKVEANQFLELRFPDRWISPIGEPPWERKIIKRGGSSDPHYLIIVQPVEE